MRVQLSAILCVCAIMAIGTVASAGSTVTFLPGDASVQYSANIDSGFYVNPTGADYFGTTGYGMADSWAGGANPLFSVQASSYAAGAYADAGIVLFMDGSLKLGQLKSVTLTDAGDSNRTPTVNLWLDTGKNGEFFAFSGYALTGLDGDSYFSGVAGNVDQSTHFYGMGVLGKATNYTLAELQSGVVAGIDADTPVSLWIGVTSPSTPGTNLANIGRVDVAVPEPATMSLLALGGLALIRRRK